MSADAVPKEVGPGRVRRRTLLGVGLSAVVLGPLGWFRQASVLPDRYSVMTMGYLDGGSGPVPDMAGMAGMDGRGVDTLVDTSTGPPDVEVTLTARRERLRLSSGRVVDGYTVNGTSPGPVVTATQGQLVQVRLVNESVPDGVTLHWHGVDVPCGADGVAGVTQDAVPIGAAFSYRFRARQVGTFWYHSHQLSHEQVQRGLLGALVITPPGATPVLDALAVVHIYDGLRTINGAPGDVVFPASAGDTMRARVINTDNGPMPVWVAGAGFRLVAVDGTDLHEPSALSDTAVIVTAGGRADLEIVMPPGRAGVRVEMGGSSALVLGSGAPPTHRPGRDLDLLTYGAPAPLGFDPSAANRRFDYVIGRRPGFLDGAPGIWWTINGRLWPDVPTYVVREGDVVRMRVVNSSGEVHPMHLHGHHAVVLSRNGVAAVGSPWWVDSLDVVDGDTYDIAFVAGNPGIWMDHCHNLPHAAQGLTAHLMYQGLTTPYTIGTDHALHDRGWRRQQAGMTRPPPPAKP